MVTAIAGLLQKEGSQSSKYHVPVCFTSTTGWTNIITWDDGHAQLRDGEKWNLSLSTQLLTHSQEVEEVTETQML